MLRLRFFCLALGLAGCATAPPPVLDMRLENPTLASAPESPAARYRPDLQPAAEAKMPMPGATGTAAEEPGMSHEHGMPGMNHPAGGKAPAQATLYACPMHPEKHYSEPGKCPICGMTLEPVEQDKERHP